MHHHRYRNDGGGYRNKQDILLSIILVSGPSPVSLMQPSMLQNTPLYKKQ